MTEKRTFRPQPETAIARAVRLAHGQSGLKKRLQAVGERVSQQGIGLWLKDGRCGKGWALPIARAIEFQVTPHELDEERYPNPWDGLPIEHARALLERAA